MPIGAWPAVARPALNSGTMSCMSRAAFTAASAAESASGNGMGAPKIGVYQGFSRSIVSSGPWRATSAAKQALLLQAGARAWRDTIDVTVGQTCRLLGELLAAVGGSGFGGHPIARGSNFDDFYGSGGIQIGHAPGHDQRHDRQTSVASRGRSARRCRPALRQVAAPRLVAAPLV
jgi:hypothetical protein